MKNINFKDFDKFKLQVRDKWMRYPKLWWGDRLDSRFIALYLMSGMSGRKVLDVGCNVGVVLSFLDGTNFKVGLDNSLYAAQAASVLNDGNAAIISGDMTSLPVKDNAFDAVIFMNMIELCDAESKKRSIKEISRVLKRNGELIMTTPNSRYPGAANKGGMLDCDSLKELLGEGYEFEIHGFNPFPPPPYFLPNRVLEKVPYIWRMLVFLMKNNFMLKRCRSFIVFARKR